ncbi:MAG: hypothetical protein QOE82_3392, partial [Thermoanaerobaculia bacterium]|nr:hypothetical protein [Thermoanaerobaculia bacterium]
TASTVDSVIVHYKRPDTGNVILDCPVIP